MRFACVATLTCILLCAYSLTIRINACPIYFDSPAHTTNLTNLSPKKSHENTKPPCTQSCEVHCTERTQQEQIIADTVSPDIKHVSVTPDY